MSEQLHFSSNPPTESGWYWIKSGFIGDGVVEVIVRPGHEYLCIRNPWRGSHEKRDFFAVAKLGAEWAGPIVEPNP